MKASNRVQVILFVAALLLVCGLSAAQKPNTKDWGKATDGLQMSIYRDQAEGRQSEFSKFRVEFRNSGHSDLLLNLGIMSRNGAQHPNAVSLIFDGGQGEPNGLNSRSPFRRAMRRMQHFFCHFPLVLPSRSRWI